MNPEAYTEMAEVESKHWWFVGRRRILESILTGLALKKNATILEIGCGTGGNIDMLSNFGVVSAIEMDETAINIAKKKGGGKCKILLGHCPESIPNLESKFDLICMFDVLEHIEKDGETLSAIQNLLNPGGRIILTVPAYQWMYGKHDEFLHHKRRYTVNQIKKIAKHTNLSIDRVTYFNTLLFLPAALVRIKDRFLPRESATGTGMPPSFINTLLKSIFSLERNLLNNINLPFGVSVLTILYKK